MTIVNYLIDLRLKMAASMLHISTLNVNEIISKVGFNDSKHFRRLFKKTYCLTPKAYREKFCHLVKAK
jgi:transcriptional regulator GlxA family with amidase domain